MTEKTIKALLVASDTAVTLASEATDAERRRCLMIIEEINAHGRFYLTAAEALAKVHKRIAEGGLYDGANYPSAAAGQVTSAAARPEKLDEGIAKIIIRLLWARWKLRRRVRELSR